MIFLTVGTQLPFDRLVAAVDDWAALNPEVELFGQIGAGDYKPLHFRHADYLTPEAADNHFRRASLIVSHAGMGSILTALKYRKSILMLPRRAALGEHRNDHQLATAKWLGQRPGIVVAEETADVGRLLDRRESFGGGDAIGDFAETGLILRLQDFVSMRREPGVEPSARGDAAKDAG
ncbi:UDP-N-acetylglucosamine transferase subunit ALG13 [Noviherbaspirillum humi]|uniref:UDP-N-acetylglucosamine transferase subunit ALG13 n=1 Tax=Noviherbaspirillum humi TaxID=1688639 RepID=A0A239C2C8_9BURK|nr:glycosyltransferase [Noviherbaspirillum humi]SNS14417.1 UDP-N-acetylglucosamine transferase subunit ALG13 [Noviherbaspirillum humi]